MAETIYDFVKAEESRFKTDEIHVGDNMLWSFRNHVQIIFHFKNGYFLTGNNDYTRAFKAVMEPMLTLAYWTEDIEVKEITFFIEERNGRVLSFLIKKYHDEVYSREHDLDEMLDQITESDIDYGGVLAQKGVERPEILALTTVAFCDQTHILGGPLAFKHHFTPSKLRSMSKFGWGKESNGATISLEDLCSLADNQRLADSKSNQKNQVPGKTIEIYIVRGNMPETYLDDNGDEEYHCNQLQIIAYYTDKDAKQQGVTLYRKEEKDGAVKFFASREVEGRALGRGIGESLLHDQIWTNFLYIHKMQMLESAAKSPLYTDDPSYTTKNKIQDMENNEITTISSDSKLGIRRIETVAVNNVQIYEASIEQIFAHAQLQASAFDPVLGIEAASGTTFRGQERVVAQGKGPHDWRKGRRAKFVEEIYRDWIIPDMVREILSGKKFLATLSSDELSWVADQLATNHVNQRIKEMIFAGKMPTKEEQAQFTELFKKDFLKKGNKHLIEVLKDEFRDIEVKIGINVANKQKNLANLSDKILAILQQAAVNPMFRQNLETNGLMGQFNDILEFSGISPADFTAFTQMNSTVTPSQQNQPSPVPAPQPLASVQSNGTGS